MKNESQVIEYKESWKDEYLKWICGFANAQGGTLYIGVNDDKQVVGIGNAKRLMEDLPNKIVTTMGIVPDVNLLNEGDKEYIQIVVEPSNMPIAYKGQYHFRSGSTKQELKGVALQQFLMKKMGHTWDDVVIPNTSVKDIDRSIIDYFIERGISSSKLTEDDRRLSTETILRTLNLIAENGNLKAAALLLFTERPSRWFPGVQFKIGRFHTDESDLIIQDVIDGNIMQMADKVMRALKSMYLVSPIHYEGLQRVEELEIPEKALREVIYNAIAHKDYTGAPIQMRVYDDRIVVWNYGSLPPDITPESLLGEHPSVPRNKNIANTFFNAGFIESWGRGYMKIEKELKRVGLPMPKVEEAFGGVKVTLKRRPMDEIVARGDGEKTDVSKNVSKDVSDNVSDNVSDHVIDARILELPKRQQLICDMIKRNPYVTAKEMSVTLSVTIRTVYRDLAQLQKKSIVRHEGQDNAGIWVILEIH